MGAISRLDCVDPRAIPMGDDDQWWVKRGMTRGHEEVDADGSDRHDHGNPPKMIAAQPQRLNAAYLQGRNSQRAGINI